MTDKVGPSKAPCGSCPYRKDVPSGVWAREEYEKLKTYDGEPFEQVLKGGISLFMCHQNDGTLCAGWVGCHNKTQSMALRLHSQEVTPETFSYESPVPLFSSGTEAAEHGMAEIDNPSPKAKATVDKLVHKRVMKFR
jgi:hypothetical protein